MRPLPLARAAAVPEIAREGLPYWIAGLLTSVIVLLLVFIFLRDRDLRLRINEFFSGAKKGVKRARLRLRLTRERKRRTEALAELGRAAWSVRLGGEAYESCLANLAILEKEGRATQTELQEVLTGVLNARKRQDEISAAAGGRSGNATSSGLREEAPRLKKSEREGERKIRAGQAVLRSIEERRAAQFVELGDLVEQARPDAAEFLGTFVRIDKHNRTILHYMNELEKFL
jgi:hypothetical protein